MGLNCIALHNKTKKYADGVRTGVVRTEVKRLIH